MSKAMPMAKRTDNELLEIILNSDASLEEKARAVLSVREQSVMKRQNRYLLIITLVASVATSIQAAPILAKLNEDKGSNELTCQCLHQIRSGDPATRQRERE